MNKENAIKIFDQNQVRVHWDDDKELWYISVIDVIQVLTDSINPQAYWRKLKQRLKEEGNETVTNLHGLKSIDWESNCTRSKCRYYGFLYWCRIRCLVLKKYKMRNKISEYFIYRAKNGLLYGLIFIFMSIYFYFDNNMNLTQLLLIVGVIQLVMYIIYKYSKSKKRK